MRENRIITKLPRAGVDGDKPGVRSPGGSRCAQTTRCAEERSTQNGRIPGEIDVGRKMRAHSGLLKKPRQKNTCDAFATLARNISLSVSNAPLCFTLSSGVAAYRRAKFEPEGSDERLRASHPSIRRLRRLLRMRMILRLQGEKNAFVHMPAFSTAPARAVFSLFGA